MEQGEARPSRRRFLAAGSAAGLGGTAYGSAAAKPAAAAVRTLFAFDDVGIPFHENVYLRMSAARKHPASPVLKRGKPGEPDEYRAQYYGSVIRHEGKFKMWYVAADYEALRAATRSPHSFTGWRAAYAESVDGLRWTKPNLGLVEYGGSRDNNLVLVEPPELMGLHLLVLHEPEDPDPGRRFKMMITMSAGSRDTSVPLYSSDGLRWRAPRAVRAPGSIVREQDFFLPSEHFEQSGLYKWRGAYHLAGQQFSPSAWLPDGRRCGRVMTVLRSRDFLHWPGAKTLAFVRHGYKPAPPGTGEEAHLPAAVWNRGNVLLALYGQWHGAARPEERRMDLGLLLSNDGVHFREAVDDFVFLPRGGPGEWDANGLIQGQGFEHVGDELYIWYGNWDLSETREEKAIGQVGLATLPRDRFGCLAAKDPSRPAGFVSAPLRTTPGTKLFVNADGLSPEAPLTLELLDERDRPLPRYSGGNAIPQRQSGFRLPAAWRAADRLPAGTFSIRAKFGGGAQVYALYVEA